MLLQYCEGHFCRRLNEEQAVQDDEGELVLELFDWREQETAKNSNYTQGSRENMHASLRGDKVANTFDSLASQMLMDMLLSLSLSPPPTLVLSRHSLLALQVTRAISLLQDLLKMRACDMA